MFSWFSSRQGRRSSPEEEPLLPRYEADTARQRQLREKLHTYQMLRAVTQGYLPSTEQAVANLRTTLTSDVLNPSEEFHGDVSEAGQLLAHLLKAWLRQFIKLVQNKNGGDKVQDFVWYLYHARLEVDLEDVAERVSASKAKADTEAVYSSIQTVGSLLLTNSDFQLFLQDLSAVFRQIFRDTAFTLSQASQETGKKLDRLDKGKERSQSSSTAGAGEDGENIPKQNVEEVLEAAAEGASTAAQKSITDMADKFQDEEPRLLERLKAAVYGLRRRQDYSGAASTISGLIKQYLKVYSRMLKTAGSVVEEDTELNKETEKAVENFWAFVQTFGDEQRWQDVKKSAQDVATSAKDDPEFESLIYKIGELVQDMLTEPDFFEHAEERFNELRGEARRLQAESSLPSNCEELLDSLSEALKSVGQDTDVQNLLLTTKRITQVLFPRNQAINSDLVRDAVNHFVPSLIQAIQHVPIPRLEISTPDVDLLLESLVLQPGKLVSGTSFLPCRFRVETRNNIDFRKARVRTRASLESFLTVKIEGLTLRADDFSFWLRAHSGLLRLADEGIASFALDKRGVDIEVDVEIDRDGIEKIIILHGVRVKIHRLDYKLAKSKFSFLAWLLRPFLRPLLRKVVETRIAQAVEENMRLANRELVFARERLRATRVADPDDFAKFVKAVAARMKMREDPDVDVRVGARAPGKGIFRGVYAPGSLVKVWEDEAVGAKKRVKEFREGGWRNDIFDVPAC